MIRSWLPLGIVVACLGCDSKEAPERPSSPDPAWEASSNEPATGSRFEDADFILEVEPARRCEGDTPLAPQKGYQRISVPVEVNARSKRGVPVGPLLFSLEDARGHRYRATLAGCAPPVAPTTLKEGEKLVGEISFDVPRDSERLELIFSPFLIGRDAVSARVKIEPVP